jgi:hypothetical protein
MVKELAKRHSGIACEENYNDTVFLPNHIRQMQPLPFYEKRTGYTKSSVLLLRPDT